MASISGKRRQSSDKAEDTSASKKLKGSGRQNVGGASTLKWFNLLLGRADLQFIREDLYNQLEEHSKVDDTSNTASSCIIFHKDTKRPRKRKGSLTPPQSPAASSSAPSTPVRGSSKDEVIDIEGGEEEEPQTPPTTPPSGADAGEAVLEHPRIEPRLPTKTRLKEKFPLFAAVLPIKINASHVALLKAGKPRPDQLPPHCPQDWFKSLFGRLATDAEAKWVASHLCHRKDCVEPSHIVWEPGWYNRARDNCPGKVECATCHTQPAATCGHFPQCIRAHRAPALDWRTLPMGNPFPGERTEDIDSLFTASSSSSGS